jgi:hypothetical protein
MGCWCETDGITQLPINYGDKVRLFVMIHQDTYPFEKDGEGGGGTCYSNDRWSPIGPPIQGTYNEYGGVEEIIYDDNAKMVETQLRNGWVQPKTLHEWDKVPELDEMKLEDFIAFIERDRGKADVEHRGVKHLGLMMVLEEAYQAMISFDEIDAHHDFLEKTFVYMPYSQMLQQELKDWYDKTVGLYSHGTVDGFDYDLLAELSGETLFYRSRKSGTHVFKQRLIELAKKKLPYEHKRVQAVATSLLELIRFSAAMDRARKQWMPQSGKGGQHNELEIYQIINAASNKIIEARIKQALEDGCEPKDENGYTPYMIEHNAKQVPAKKAR